MRFWFFTFLFILTWNAQAGVSPTPTLPPTFEQNLMLFQLNRGDDNITTYRMIDEQERIKEARSTSIWNQDITTGHARAQEMVDLLKKQELQKVFAPLNERGKQMLQENPEMKSPVAIIAGAASLWIGKTLRLMKSNEIKVYTRVEARSRSGEFSLESPILNGKLVFTGSDGFSMSMNRSISSIDSSAEMVYSAKDQSLGGSLVHPLSQHINLNFGASSSVVNPTEERASLNYHINF